MNVANMEYFKVTPELGYEWELQYYKNGQFIKTVNKQPGQSAIVGMKSVSYTDIYLSYKNSIAPSEEDRNFFYVEEIKTIHNLQDNECIYVNKIKNYNICELYIEQNPGHGIVWEKTVSINSCIPNSKYIYYKGNRDNYEIITDSGYSTIKFFSPSLSSIHIDAWSEDAETLGWPVVNIPAGDVGRTSFNSFIDNNWSRDARGYLKRAFNPDTPIYFLSNYSDYDITITTSQRAYTIPAKTEINDLIDEAYEIWIRDGGHAGETPSEIQAWLNQEIKDSVFYHTKNNASNYTTVLYDYKDFSPIVFFWEENNYQFPEGEQIIVDGQDREIYFSMRNAVSMDGAAKLVLKKNNNLTISRGNFLTEFKFKQEEWQSTLTLKECNLNGYDTEEANAYPVFEASNLRLEKCKIEHYRMGLIGVITNLSNQVNLVIQNCYIEWLDYLMNFRLDGTGLNGLFKEAQINNNYIIKTKILLKARSNLIFNNNIIECLDNYHYRYEVDLNDNMNVKPNANNNYFLGYISIGEDTQKNLLKNRNFYYLQ